MRNAFLTLLTVLFITFGAHGAEKTLHTFKHTDGLNPYAGLTEDYQGNLYGTTWFGGSLGQGVVFELVRSQNWTEQILYNFSGGLDGGVPSSPLLRDSAGNLYGTTQSGGQYGAGTVFALLLTRSGWTERVLWTFNGTSDGNAPSGNLAYVRGSVYGTTQLAGGNCDCGTVYKLSDVNSRPVLTVLHHFTGENDGGSPLGGLVADSAGNLYGTTYNEGPNGTGTVFELSPSGDNWVGRLLFVFAHNGSNGAYSTAPLVLDRTGNLYGTTSSGGAFSAGVVFELNPTTGNESTLYNFTGGQDEGAPGGGVALDSAGNLYGTTSGAEFGLGTVFELTPTTAGWKETTLYTFTGQADGDTPESGVILDEKARALFGSASGLQGGTPGSVYAITAAQ